MYWKTLWKNLPLPIHWWILAKSFSWQEFLYLWFFSMAFIKQLLLSTMSVVLMSAPFFSNTLTHRWCPHSAASMRDLFYTIMRWLFCKYFWVAIHQLSLAVCTYLQWLFYKCLKFLKKVVDHIVIASLDGTFECFNGPSIAKAKALFTQKIARRRDLFLLDKLIKT